MDGFYWLILELGIFHDSTVSTYGNASRLSNEMQLDYSLIRPHAGGTKSQTSFSAAFSVRKTRFKSFWVSGFVCGKVRNLCCKKLFVGCGTHSGSVAYMPLNDHLLQINHV
jgi:hypothetical protein